MFLQKISKIRAHDFCRQDIVAFSDAAHLAAHQLRQGHPRGQRENHRDRGWCRLPPDCLQEQHQNQRRQAHQKLAEAHQKRIQCARRQSADRAVNEREQARQQRAEQTDIERKPAAVQEHRQKVTPQTVCSQRVRQARRQADRLSVHDGNLIRCEPCCKGAACHNQQQEHKRRTWEFPAARLFSEHPSAARPQPYSMRVGPAPLLSAAARRVQLTHPQDLLSPLLSCAGPVLLRAPVPKTERKRPPRRSAGRAPSANCNPDTSRFQS